MGFVATPRGRRAAFHRRRVGRGVAVRHLGDPVTGELDEHGAGLGNQVLDVEELPVGVLDLGLASDLANPDLLYRLNQDGSAWMASAH
jgi:hypothetical protein